MWSKLIATICMIMMVANTLSSQAVQHYYVQAKGKNIEDISSLSYGEVVHKENGAIKLKPMDIDSMEAFVEYIAEQQSNLPYEFVLYIHGMWANQPRLWKETAKTIHDDILAPQEVRQVMISVIWDAAVAYPNSVKQAHKKGVLCSPLLGHIWHKLGSATKFSVLAHSMGNRVFQHMVTPYLESPPGKIDTYFAVAADLEHNIFSKNQPLAKLPSICDNIVVYRHNNDRTLMISKMLNKNERLGLYGLDSTMLSSCLIDQVDVSLITDYQMFTKDLFNHRYYYTNDNVTTDMKLCLAEKDNPYRKQLTGLHHVQLLPKEED